MGYTLRLDSLMGVFFRYLLNNSNVENYESEVILPADIGGVMSNTVSI